jgi:hypothetical protein
MTAPDDPPTDGFDLERHKLLQLARQMERTLERMAGTHHGIAVAVAGRIDPAQLTDTVDRFGTELDEFAERVGDFARALEAEEPPDAAAR